jgi:hypothetical protein
MKPASSVTAPGTSADRAGAGNAQEIWDGNAKLPMQQSPQVLQNALMCWCE